MSLDDIGLHYGTDKASSHHGYLDIYEREIHPGRAGALLELGWQDGASMRMWRDWLPEAWRVVGLDIEYKQPIDGVTFIHGSQDELEVSERAGAHGLFDVIVDDASHESGPTIDALNLFWPHLKPGGLYFIEDLGTAYLDHWITRGTLSHMDVIHDKVDETVLGAGGISRISFWKSLVLLEKAQ